MLAPCTLLGRQTIFPTYVGLNHTPTTLQHSTCVRGAPRKGSAELQLAVLSPLRLLLASISNISVLLFYYSVQFGFDSLTKRVGQPTPAALRRRSQNVSRFFFLLLIRPSSNLEKRSTAFVSSSVFARVLLALAQQPLEARVASLSFARLASPPRFQFAMMWIFKKANQTVLPEILAPVLAFTCISVAVTVGAQQTSWSPAGE